MSFLALKIDLIIWYYFTRSHVEWQLSSTATTRYWCSCICVCCMSIIVSKLSIKPNENTNTGCSKIFVLCHAIFSSISLKKKLDYSGKRPSLSVVSVHIVCMCVCVCTNARDQYVNETNGRAERKKVYVR